MHPAQVAATPIYIHMEGKRSELGGTQLYGGARLGKRTSLWRGLSWQAGWAGEKNAQGRAGENVRALGDQPALPLKKNRASLEGAFEAGILSFECGMWNLKLTAES
jgi:hypothetical protein